MFPTQLRQVLAIIDFSTSGIRAAWRAAHLAWAHGAELCLLSLVELPDASPTSRHGATAPPVRARADLMYLAESIHDSLGIRPAIVVGAGAEAPSILHECALRSNVAVLPAHGPLGERLIRDWGLPVLVARRPADSVHRRVMAVAQPGSGMVSPLLAAAQWLCKPESISVVQPLDQRFRGRLQVADQSLLTIQDRADAVHARAQATLHDELARAGLQGSQGRIVLGSSAANLAHLQKSSGTTLLVVSKARRAWWKDVLLPSLAGQLSGRVHCDVLVLPEPLSGSLDRWRSPLSPLPAAAATRREG